MKTLTLIYCNDGNAGKALAATIRNDAVGTGLRDASTFSGALDIEPCDSVIVMDDVQQFYRDRIVRAYNGKTQPQVTPFEPSKIVEPPQPVTKKRGRPRKVPVA